MEEDSVLFSKRSELLYGLDRTATTALLRLAGGEEPETVVDHTGTSAATPAMIAQLSDLLAGKEVPGEGYRDDLSCPPEVPPVPNDLPRYLLLGTCFALQGPDKLLQRWLIPWLAHLGHDSSHTDLLISFEPTNSGWSLIFNGTSQGDSLNEQQLLPLLVDRLRKFAYQRHDYLLAIHSAVVSKENCTLILPGQAGSGKSTLAVSLLAQGYRLFSDEVAVLDNATNEVLSLPLGAGVKRGSWPVLEHLYPDLTRQPVHIRRDDREVRYLLSNDFLARTDERAHASHLIFPTFTHNSSTQLTELTPIQALRMLTEAGYQVSGLNENKVQKILNWLTSLDCCTMTYASTADALDILESLLTKQTAQPKHAHHVA